jgi:hypothetical protein
LQLCAFEDKGFIVMLFLFSKYFIVECFIAQKTELED